MYSSELLRYIPSNLQKWELQKCKVVLMQELSNSDHS